MQGSIGTCRSIGTYPRHLLGSAAAIAVLCASQILALPAAPRDTHLSVLDAARRLRLEGALTEAVELARRELERSDLEATGRIALHLESARIH